MIEQGGKDEVQEPALAMAAADNARMRKVGCALAESALHVIREYDGTHRLSLAVAEWARAIANEGHRESAYAAPNLQESVLWKAMYQNAVTALAMIREAVESFGPATSLESQEAVLLRGPEPIHDAEAIIDALLRLKPVRNRVLEAAIRAVRSADRVAGPLDSYGDHAEEGYKNGLADAKSAIRALRSFSNFKTPGLECEEVDGWQLIDTAPLSEFNSTTAPGQNMAWNDLTDMPAFYVWCALDGTRTHWHPLLSPPQHDRLPPPSPNPSVETRE